MPPRPPELPSSASDITSDADSRVALIQRGSPQRWTLIRDVLVFQAKLLLDGLRDLILGPVALVAGLVGLLASREDPARPFKQVMELGDRFDRWVDLFGTRRRENPRESQSQQAEGVDAYVEQIEELLREQCERGGLTQSAKAKIDRWLDAIVYSAKRGPRQP